MLKITDFSKTYKGGKKAVSHLNLEILPGDIYGFIGHNGAGKTTTIKAAVGILDFEEGEILIDGHSIEKEPLLCKSMLAYIPDNPDLYEHLTGIQYLNFIADIFRLDSGVRTERIREYAEPFVGLDPSASVVLKQNMHELCKEGSAIFFSTHVLDVAEKLCNKIAIIKNGELVVSGETSELTHGKSLEEVFMEVVKGD